MYIDIAGHLIDVDDPEARKKLQDVLSNTPDLFSEAYDSEFHQLLHAPHHLPCLTHVIQLAVRAFLQELRIQSNSDDPTAQWDDKDKTIRETGLLRTLEKVC